MSKLQELAYKITQLLDEYGCSQDVAMYANDDTITMTFKGPFYEVVNYGLFPELLDRFVDLIESYGYYYELGNAWNLSLFEI